MALEGYTMTDEEQKHHLRDLVAAYVLGSVTPLERELIDSHLAACASCRQVEAELREVEALLPSLTPELDPPPALKTRVMEAVRAEPRAARPEGVLPAPSVRRVAPSYPVRRELDSINRARRGVSPAGRVISGRVAALALAAAVVLLAVGIGAWRVWGVRQPVPTTQVAIAGTPLQPAISGSLRYFAAGGRLDLDVHGLKPIPSGRVYELWLIRGHYRVVKDVGAFRPSSDGTGRLTTTSPDVSNYTLTRLTVEQTPGARRPTTPLVAFGNIDA
jgi:anti-sigma-K factor RskA